MALRRLDRLSRAAAIPFALACLAAEDAPVLDPGTFPISVEWDRSTAFVTQGGDKVAVVEGNVIARQGDVALRADRAEVTIGSKPSRVTRVVASGDVTVTWGKKLARADSAAWDGERRAIVFSGSPTVVEEGGVLRAREIVFHVAEGRVVCSDCSIEVDPTKMREILEDAQRGRR